MSETLITAHAGAEHTSANTLESLLLLADLGADALEADVRQYDGRLILSHDAAKAGDHLCLLSDALSVVTAHPALRINLDLKQHGLMQEVLTLARQYGICERLIFTGCLTAQDMALAQTHHAEAWYTPDDDDSLEAALCAGFPIVNIDHHKIPDMPIADADRLSLWTVDDPAALARCMGRGFRSITTREVRLALHMRRMIQNFHRQWDDFPGSARLIDAAGHVLAASPRARQAGFIEGLRCAAVKTANNHRACLLKNAFKTGQGQFDVSPTGFLRTWTPVSEWDGAMLHLSYKP